MADLLPALIAAVISAVTALFVVLIRSLVTMQGGSSGSMERSLERLEDAVAELRRQLLDHQEQIAELRGAVRGAGIGGEPGR